MSDNMPAPPTGEPRQFAWHPQYRGQSVADVRRTIRENLRADQRSYALALEGPEDRENDMLARIVELERRWGPFAMDWSTADLDELSGRVVDFELERDARQELFPYSEYRDRHTPVSAPAPGGSDDERESAAPWWAFWRR